MSADREPGSRRRKSPVSSGSIVPTLVIYIATWWALGLALTYAGHIWDPNWNPHLDATAILATYAFSWGALGACLNASMALAKHCADRDFDEAWQWWYLAKPPMGAMVGLAVYVLARGLSGFVSGEMQLGTGVGVAALAFLAGYATERVVRKIEEISKTTFAAAPRPPGLDVLEPLDGQQVTEGQIYVAVSAPGTADYARAICLDAPSPGATELAQISGNVYGGSVPIGTLRAPLEKAIRITAVVEGRSLERTVEIQHVGYANGEAEGGD